MKEPIRQFIFKALFFIALILLLDTGIGGLLNHFYFTQKAGDDYRATYAIENAREQVIILGASRASHQYLPEIIEKRLKMSCFNTGRDGASIFYSYGILKALSSRYRPELIILDFSRDFEKKQNSYDRLAMLAPYYHRHPEIKPIIEIRSKYEKFKMYSGIYPFNSYLFSIAQRNTNYNIENLKDVKGYTPLFRKWNRPADNDSSFLKYDIDSSKVEIYKSIIKECNGSRVNLVIVAAPFFNNAKTEDISTKLAKQIAVQYHVPFFDFSKDSSFRNKPEYFADISHLNDEGARKFTNLVLDSIINSPALWKH